MATTADAIPEDGFDALNRFAPEIASETEESDKTFTEEFESAQTDAEREARIVNYYSVDRFRKPPEALLALDPIWAREYYKEWLKSLLQRDYRKIYDLLEPHSDIKRRANGTRIRENRIARRRLYYCWKVGAELLAQADLKWRFRTVQQESENIFQTLTGRAAADSLGGNREQAIVSPTEPAANFRGVIESLAAARRMETYIKGIGAHACFPPLSGCMLKLIAAVPLILVFISGCARYQVKPLQPEVRLSEFKARTLDEPSLIQYVNSNLRSPMTFPQPRWELPALTLVAFRYHPEIELARARAASVEAAIATASQRSNPNFSFGTTLETPFQDTLPWILTPALDLLFERPAERKFRTAEARHLANAARWDIGATAWQVRSRLRTRFTDHIFAVRELELLREEEAIRTEYLSLLQAKLELGDVSRLEIEASRIELQRVRLQVNTAEGRVSETRAALPEAVGLSAGAIAALEFYEPRLEKPVELTADQLRTLESDALLNRVDIYRALDQYAAAEAALQMEIAAQRPNFALGPAFRWREGQQRWTLGVSFDLPIFNRNQGPIGEAEARRETVARGFDRLQASVVAEVEQASATYRAAINERQSVDELNSAAEDLLTATQQLFDLREVDYTTVVAARLEAALARTAGILALRRVHVVLAMIENAIQRPLGDEFSIPDDLELRPAAQQTPE